MTHQLVSLVRERGGLWTAIFERTTTGDVVAERIEVRLLETEAAQGFTAGKFYDFGKVRQGRKEGGDRGRR